MTTMGSEPLPPCNVEAEIKFLGTLILDQSDLQDIMVELTTEAFFDRTNRAIYSVICTLYAGSQPVTVDTIAQGIKIAKTERGDVLFKDMDATSRLLQALDGVSSGEQGYWKDIVSDESQRRDLFYFTQDSYREAASGKLNPAELRAHIEEGVISLYGDTGPDTVPIGAVSEELEARMEKYFEDSTYISGNLTGYGSIDSAMDGLQPGNVTIVYAPSSSFKSLFVQNVGLNLAQQGVPGLWFTTEMPRVQVMERVLQLQVGLNIKKLRRQNLLFGKKREIKIASQMIAELPIYFCDKSALDITELRAEVSRNKRWHDIEYIIVDLVDHVSSKRYKDEMVNNQRIVMSEMKAIAKELNVHVLLVSHVAKGDREMRHKKVGLDMEDMIGSSAKYQDVDVAINIHPCMRDEENYDKLLPLPPVVKATLMRESGIILCQVAIMKNRHGELVFDVMHVDLSKGGRFISDVPSIPTHSQKGLDIDEEE